MVISTRLRHCLSQTASYRSTVDQFACRMNSPCSWSVLSLRSTRSLHDRKSLIVSVCRNHGWMNESGKESLFLERSQAVLQAYKRRRGWRNAALGFSLAIIVKHGK